MSSNLSESTEQLSSQGSVSVNKSGWLKKKGKIFGRWSPYFVELHHKDLYLRKNETTNKIRKHYVITPDTKIQMITQNTKIPYMQINIPNVPRPINFSAENYDILANWLIAFRSASFENSLLSMESFDIISVIGRGFFGKVLLVQNKQDKEYYAMKIVKKDRLVKSHQIHTILAERSILAKAKHPFIVNLMFAFQTVSKFHIGLEYVPGGDMIGLLQRSRILPMEDVRIYAGEIATALEHLHSIGVVYRDLKPDNILIAQDGHLKLTDFGLAKDISQSGTTRTFCGTAEYIAPEIIHGKPYAFAVDWWAFGILVYQMIFGSTPFFSEKRDSLMSKIKYADLKFPEDTDEDVKDFISKFLTKDPAERAQYKDVENHPFFHGITREDIMTKKYKPSFTPIVREKISTEYFDECFTNEKPCDSYASPMLGDDNQFNGFSYIDSSADLSIPSGVVFTDSI